MNVSLAWVYNVTPHLQTLVGCNNRSLIIDRRDTDVNGAGQTVLPDFRLIGHNGEVVSLCVAAVVDIGDVLTFHLESEAERIHIEIDSNMALIK